MLADSGSDVQRWMQEAREAYRRKFKLPREASETTTPADASLPPRFMPGDERPDTVDLPDVAEPTSSDSSGATARASTRPSSLPDDSTTTRDLPSLAAARAERARARAQARELRTMPVQHVTPTPMTVEEHTRLRAERCNRRAARREEKASSLLQEALAFLTESFDVEIEN